MALSDFLDIPRIILIFVIIFALVLLVWGSSYASVKEQKGYQDLATTPGIIQILNIPELVLETACDNGSNDLRNCEQFMYKISISEMDLDHDRGPFDMIITVSVKDSDQPVLYSLDDGELANYHRIEFGEQGSIVKINDIIIFSTKPPILNFPERKEYSSSLWNQQTMRLGEYSVTAYTSFLSSFRAKPDIGGTLEEAGGLCEARFLIRCGPSGADELRWIKVPDGESSQPQSLCRGSIKISVDKEQGSSCIQQKICMSSIDVTAVDEDKKLLNFGEKVDITFWRLSYDDNEDTVIDDTEKSYQKFVEKCSGKNFIDNQYCKNRLLNTRTFYADLGQSTDQTIPKGCS